MSRRPSDQSLRASAEGLADRPSGPQDLDHRLAPCEFVDKLVQVADLLHQRIIEVLECRLRGQVTASNCLIEAGQPLDHSSAFVRTFLLTLERVVLR